MGKAIELLVGLAFVAIGWNFAYLVAWKNLVTLFAYKLKAIASAQIGEKIYVAGKLAGKPTERSLFTQTPCIRWHLKVTETKGSKSKTVITLLNRRSPNSFLLADKSGLIEVFPLDHKPPLLKLGTKNFTLSATNFSAHDFAGQGQPQNCFYQNIFQNFSNPRAIAFLDEYNITHTGFLGQRKSIAISEYLGQPGDNIYVCGKVISGDRTHKCLEPWLMTTRPIYQVALRLAAFGLLGCLLFLIGCAVIYQVLHH